MTLLEELAAYEQVARVTQSALIHEGRTPEIRARLVARLATVDQYIASLKDQAGLLGKDDCSYLDD